MYINQDNLTKVISREKLIELLNTLEPNTFLSGNRVENISIFKEIEGAYYYTGFIDISQEEVDIW